jgi:hypothetical protein
MFGPKVFRLNLVIQRIHSGRKWRYNRFRVAETYCEIFLSRHLTKSFEVTAIVFPYILCNTVQRFCPWNDAGK